MPAGFDAASAMNLMLLQSPLWVLVLIGVGRHLAGGFWARTLMLAALAWITNALNNQIEASFFGSMASGFWFTILTYLVPSVLVAAAVAWLFPPASPRPSLAAAARTFFGRFPAAGWLWRLGLGAVIFMPIYYGFGLLVIPFTRAYYAQGLYGLQVPPLSVLLPVLLLRSVLFFAACLPILVAWQSTRTRLVLGLGAALFFFVGFQSLSIATWMPWALRLPHLLEILADEFVYAWALALVLAVGVRATTAAAAAPAAPGLTVSQRP
jgi:hypothetical protein